MPSGLARMLDRGETQLVLVMGLGALAITIGVQALPQRVPFTSLMLALVLGSVYLSPRTLLYFSLYVTVLMTFCVSQQVDFTSRVIGAATVQYLIAAIVIFGSLRRMRLGVGGLRGEAMFVDLRDRILSQGGSLSLPAGWSLDTALASSGGTPFAGDFLVTRLREEGRRADMVVVDVSGKGEEAGIRALQLSGGFGGLIGALPPSEFMPAANDYLLDQDWDEGFATAIHLSVDLETGAYEVRSAGHPPAVLRHAGSGRWEVLESAGPLLGLFEDPEYVVSRGRLASGDSLMLYTDGMVERPRRDIEQGLDRLLGEAEGLARGGWDDAAGRLVRAVGSHDDDRALVLFRRD